MDRIRERVTRRSFYLPLMAGALILVIIVVIALIITMKRDSKQNVAGLDRIECPTFTKNNCTKSMCVWKKVNDGPSCYMEKNKFGYDVAFVKENNNTLKVNLKQSSNSTPYGKSLTNVEFVVTYISENIIRFQFNDTQNKRYEVPVQKDFPLLQKPPEVDLSKLSYQLTHSNGTEQFYFEIKRTDDGQMLWDSKVGALLLTDQYLQIATYLPTDNVYGLGEHVHETLKHNMNYRTWPLFSQDRPPEQTGDQRNLYGVHPFITCLEKSGKSFGIFFLNSNAMDVTFLPAPAVSYRTTGGILDFFIFVGDNPEHVIQLYTSLVGRPVMPPYWSLGFHLSRYGYNDLDTLKETHNRTFKAKIPLACQFLDIDHMEGNKDFTYSNKTFSGLPEYVEETMKEHGLKWIIILDPAIAAEEEYEPYTSGVNKSVFVKKSPEWLSSMFPDKVKHVNATFGHVWPTSVVAFPDFFHEETKQWWKDNIAKHYENIKFDGLWIDMNEPSNFGTNEAYPFYCDDRELTYNNCWSLKCPNSRYEDPPYNPLLATKVNRLSDKTLCMDSIHSGENETYIHYNVHSLYGWSQTYPTLKAAQEATGTRSLVITRSTYPSSGRYSGHWLGDNKSTYDDLRRSIIGMLEFNLFGIPYIGADVCGFFGDTTEHLCKRWMQLGAFYPFYRNHNGLNQKEQDPVAMGSDVEAASRTSIERRIALNPYLYTLFYRAHADGNTVVRPLFHEFPTDVNTADLDKQFMWGKSILISPIIEKNRKNVLFYLPEDEWWKFKAEESIMEPYTKQFTTATNVDDTVIHIRGGLILPYGIYESGTRAPNINETKFKLFVFPKDDKASGELYIDDGSSIDPIENEAYTLYEFTYSNCSLNISKKEFSKSPGTAPTLESLIVFNTKSVSKVSDDYKFTTNEELHATTFTIQSGMDKVTEITWKGTDGNCDMITGIRNRFNSKES